MAEAPGIADILTVIQNLGTRLDELGTRVAAIERPSPNLHRAEHEAPEAEDPPAEHGPELHGPRVARDLHEHQIAPDLHGRQNALDLHGRQVALEMHGRRVAQEMHGRRVTPGMHGKDDPEDYLDWESRMDRIFEDYAYTENMKVQFAVAQLRDHALICWDQEMQQRKRRKEGPVPSWELMKYILKRRYVPPHYYLELQKRFNKLMQGSRSVEEYFEEFEHLRDRLQLEDDEKTLMTHFLYGLHQRVVQQIRCQSYRGFEELVHLAIQIETWNQRRSANFSRTRLQASVPQIPHKPIFGSRSRPVDIATTKKPTSHRQPNVPTKDIQDEITMILVPSREIESRGKVESYAEHLDDEDTCPKVRDDLALRIVIEGPKVLVRLWNWSWLRNVFLGDIPTGLPPQRGIEFHVDQALGTLHTVHSPPLILYKEEPPDLVSYTLPFSHFDFMVASLASCSIVSSRMELARLLGGLDLGPSSIEIACADWDIISSYVMLATRSSSFVGRRRVTDDLWIKTKPPDMSFTNSSRGVTDDLWVKTKPPDKSMRGNCTIFVDFTVSELCLSYCRNLVLWTKPLEEGGNDGTLDQQLEPELVGVEFGARRIGGTDSVGCLGVCIVAGHSTFVGKSVWTLSCQEDEELVPPTLH